jgi:hypothetical protein
VRIHARRGVTGSCVPDVLMLVAPGRSGRQKGPVHTQDNFASGELMRTFCTPSAAGTNRWGTTSPQANIVPRQKRWWTPSLGVEIARTGMQAPTGSTGMHTLHTHDKASPCCSRASRRRFLSDSPFIKPSTSASPQANYITARSVRQVAAIVANSPEATLPPRAIPAAEHPKLAVAAAVGWPVPLAAKIPTAISFSRSSSLPRAL